MHGNVHGHWEKLPKRLKISGLAISPRFHHEPAVPPQRFGLTALPHSATRMQASRSPGSTLPQGRDFRGRASGDAAASDLTLAPLGPATRSVPVVSLSVVRRQLVTLPCLVTRDEPALEGHHARSTQRHGRRPAGSHPSTAGRPARGSGIDLLDLVTGIGDGVAVRGRGIAAVVIAVAGARGSRLP